MCVLTNERYNIIIPDMIFILSPESCPRGGTLSHWVRSKGQLLLTCQFQRFLYQILCVFLQIKYRKYIEQNFHSVAMVMALGGTRGAGGVKLLHGDLRWRPIDWPL